MAKSLFSELFETFDSISKNDMADGSVNGVKSLYSIPSKDLTGITVDSLNDDRNTKQRISNLYRLHQYAMSMAAASNVDGFSKFSERLNNALDLNKVYSDDDAIRQKLASFLTYCYLSINKSKEFLVYSDFDSAKKVSMMVFSRAEKLGLKFLNSDTVDIIKTVIFTVFYKLEKPKAK